MSVCWGGGGLGWGLMQSKATGDAGNDEHALWENEAVKSATAEPASLYRQISQRWTLGHLPCDVSS